MTNAEALRILVARKVAHLVIADPGAQINIVLHPVVYHGFGRGLYGNARLAGRDLRFGATARACEQAVRDSDTAMEEPWT